MKINKDLVDATMMLSFIILVLIGTSDFSNMLLKEITMGGLALLSVAMIALRFIHMRQEANRHSVRVVRNYSLIFVFFILRTIGFLLFTSW